jgi:hypothetical protein
MQNIHFAPISTNQESAVIEETLFIQENLSFDQLDIIDSLRKERIFALIETNFSWNIDYILAITINEDGRVVPVTGVNGQR